MYPDANTLGPAVIDMPRWLQEAVVRFNESWEADQNGCHLWIGRTRPIGYGRFSVKGRDFAAHRFAYEVEQRRPLPRGLVLDHLCRVRRCVNPAHLEPVTQATNIRRGETGKNNSTKTHCPHGHPYTPENTYVIPKSGGRTCRTCNNRRRREYRERRTWSGAG